MSYDRGGFLSSIFWLTLGVGFTITTTGFSSSRAQVSNIDPLAVQNIIKHSCLVVYVKNAARNNQMKTLFTNVQKLFSTKLIENENPVFFGSVNDLETFVWPSSKLGIVYKNIADAEKRNEIVLFPKLVPDRMCLLPTPRSGETQPIAYSGGDDLTSLLNFVNSNCGTFRDANGRLKVAGHHRLDILANLYSLKSPLPNSCEGNADKIGEKDGNCAKISAARNQRSKYREMKKCEEIDVDEINGDSFFLDYLSKSKPFVVRRATSRWPAHEKWTTDFFLRRYGAKNIHVKMAPLGEFEGVENATVWDDFETFEVPSVVRSKLKYPDTVVVRPASVDMNVSEFLTIISDSSRLNVNVSAYLEYTSLADYFSELRDDISEMPFVEGVGMKLKHTNIWLSNGKTLGKLHFDPFDNFLCQISGRKESILFEPHENRELYEAHIQEAMLKYNATSQTFIRRGLSDSTSLVMSPVDINKPDFKKFPLFMNAVPLNCTIDEGDVLFMPAFWWHEVQSYPAKTEPRNLAVNFWYEPFLTREFPCPECKLDVNPVYHHLL
ncbi:jmjC domain-containing protein E-like [Tubulanus polymorphus]|uniref:jmjC domain-containing protein E-like n=1 Tax=Tubulanus polymorphus TaxID=672921 RepID=UPI003DA213AE